MVVSLTVSVIDYGIGNLGSILNMLKKLGVEGLIADCPAKVREATKIILPGVGSFDAGMRKLEQTGLKRALDEAVLDRGVPVAGICLGMQLMMKGSEEGTLPGLGWIDGSAIKFSSGAAGNLKVPHMGWGQVRLLKDSKVLTSLEPNSRFYFVHSYYVKCVQRADALLEAQYGAVSFDAAFEHKNRFGFQFHPEKSHRFGMSLLKGFVEF